MNSAQCNDSVKLLIQERINPANVRVQNAILFRFRINANCLTNAAIVVNLRTSSSSRAESFAIITQLSQTFGFPHCLLLSSQ